MHGRSSLDPPLPREQLDAIGDAPSPINLTEAQVFRLHDGDVLVFRMTQPASDNELIRASEAMIELQTRMEERISAIVLDVGIEFVSVVRPESTDR